MPEYNYSALKEDGGKIKGKLIADNRQIAVTKLKSEGLVPVTLDEVVDEADSESILRKPIVINTGVNKKKVVGFVNQMAVMLRAGVSLPLAMEVMLAQEDNVELKRILGNVNEDMLSGISLSRAMAKHPKVFNTYLVSMSAAGEANGRLDMTFERAADSMEKDQAFASKVKSMMIYPVILLIMLMVALAIINIFVFPTFIKLFEEMSVDLPPITKMVLGLSKFTAQYWWLILIVVVAIVVAYQVMKRTNGTRQKIEKFRLGLPVFGKIGRSIILSRFLRIFGSLVGAGVDIVESLVMSANVVDNLYFKEAISDVARDIRLGIPVNRAMARFSIFPPLIISMVRVGEESGMLGDVLNKLGSLYENEVDASTKRLMAMIEPAITIVIAVAVAFLIISVVLPMFKMYSSISASGG